MGHERVGCLPKTKKWRDIVQQISHLSSEDANITSIAQGTLENVRGRFRHIHLDSGVNAAFRFLVIISLQSRSDNPREQLASMGIQVAENATPLSFAKAADEWINLNKESLEYSQIAFGAATDAIARWYSQNLSGQKRLFEPHDNAFETWRKAGTGSGFCELSRIFFAKFTERYLKYFLEREASAVLNTTVEREQFGKQLEEHIDQISRHAFETAKITQSFAAGWFNKYALEQVPESQATEQFLRLAFGKMRDELLQETDHD